MAKTKREVWRAAAYARLSRDDGDSGESNSITSQKRIIQDYVDAHSDVKLVAVYDDDGFSGSNFDRPNFRKMEAAIDAGEINCVIVKDLSRFGRNYLDVGNYLDRVFPAKGVRLIAIGDDYDTVRPRDYSDALLIPFKNLINDNYCATTSAKVKAHLDAKRRKGESVSSFAPYGYLKHPRDRNRLVVDEEAASVVRAIFRMYIDGMNPAAIARRLNELGIPSPQALRRMRNEAHFQPGQRHDNLKWTHTSVWRVLNEENYTGVLAQGRTFKPSFRSKVVLPRAREEWTRVEGVIDAIIDKSTYELVQDLRLRDTRTVPGHTHLRPFSGLVFCADCGSSMYIHNVRSRGVTYKYYSCTGHKVDRSSCMNHIVRFDYVEQAVTTTVLAMLAALSDARDAWEQGAGLRVAEQNAKLLAQ